MSESHSRIFNNNNLLFPIQMEDDKNDQKYVNNLLQKTKSLVLSNKNYNRFMKKYLILTQESSFKLPEINNYPILKNESLIPINRQTFSSGSQFVRTTNNFTNNTHFFEQKKNLDNTNHNIDFPNSNIEIQNKTRNSNLMANNSNSLFPNISIDNNNNNNAGKDMSSNNVVNNFKRESKLVLNDLKNENKFNFVANTPNNYNINNPVALIGHNNKNKPNINETNHNIMTNYENNETSKNLKNKKILFENEMRIKSIIRSHSTTNNLFEKKFTSSNSSQFEYYGKEYLNKNLYLSSDYKTLILDLLVDFEFNNQIFNYDETVKNKFNEKSNNFDEIKKSRILDKLRMFINNLIQGKNENVTSELKKIYEVLDDRKIELKVSSLELEFIPYNPTNEDTNNNYFNIESNKDLNFNNLSSFIRKNNNNNYNYNPNDENIQRIKIPFSLMPIFYYSKLESFYALLAKMLNVNKYFYKSNEESDKELNKEIKENAADEACENNVEFDNKNKANENKDDENNSDEIKIDFETVRKVLGMYKDFIFENENYSKDITNSKTFEWISTNKRFLIRILPPKIEFYLTDNTFYISKNLPKEMLIYLLNKSFINYDFFILNYLSKFKSFRDNVNERFYKKIKQTKIKTRKLTSEVFNNEADLKLNDFTSLPLRISLDDKINEPELKSLNNINFFYTNSKGETNFFILNSFEFKISLKSETIVKTVKNYSVEENINVENKDYIFKFSMDQLVKLQKLKKFYNLKDYLRRMVVTLKKKINNNNGYIKIKTVKGEQLGNIKVDFDLKYFESLDDNFFKFLTKTDSENILLLKNDEDSLNNLTNEEKEDDSIVFDLKNPTINWFEGNDIKTVEIPEIVLNKLKKNPINNWLKDISRVIPDMVENYEKYITINKKQSEDEINAKNINESKILSPNRDTFKRLSSNLNFKKSNMNFSRGTTKENISPHPNNAKRNSSLLFRLKN